MPPVKLSIIILSLFLCFIGLMVIIFSPLLLKFLIRTNLILTPGTDIYEFWKHFPTPVPMDFYFFNWTNPHDIYNKSVKPKFEEVGPYKFVMDLGKSNITWNDNGTVTYQPQRYWYYREEKDNGNLQDNVTVVNILSLSTAHVARTWNYMVRKGLSFTLSQISPNLSMTKTVDELLFSGYPDTLAKMARTFPFFAGTEIPPFDRFGWFYQRNGSDFLSGINNVGTGLNSTYGKIYNWNYRNKTPHFRDQCAELGASIGEYFEPESLEEYIKIFSSDLCRAMVLQYVSDAEVDGVTGRKYIIGDYMLDNGTTYPEHKCSCHGDCLPKGVFNVSSCRYGAPTFGSLPHFYRADHYYNNLIEGSKPDKDKHEFYVIIEPNTGFPLRLRLNLQINMLLHPISAVNIYEDVPTVLMPMLWFQQRIDIPQKEFDTVKLLLNVPYVCTIVGILTIIVGLVLLLCNVTLWRKKQRLSNDKVSVKMKGAKIEATALPEEKSLL